MRAYHASTGATAHAIAAIVTVNAFQLTAGPPVATIVTVTT
jgi:hypothetical protein